MQRNVSVLAHTTCRYAALILYMFPPFLVPAYDEDQEDSFFLVNLEKLSGSLAPIWNKRFMHNEVVFLTYCFSQLHGMVFKRYKGYKQFDRSMLIHFSSINLFFVKSVGGSKNYDWGTIRTQPKSRSLNGRRYGYHISMFLFWVEIQTRRLQVLLSSYFN